ncbi:MAG: hypothetical protein ACTSX9_07155 [Candidatus Njordarchaeales archaeon]
MNPKRIKKLKEILDLTRNIYFAKKELSLLKSQFEEILEVDFDEAIQSLDEALASLKVILGNLITRNIFESWER